MKPQFIKDIEKILFRPIPQVWRVDVNSVGYMLDKEGKTIFIGLRGCRLLAIPESIGDEDLLSLKILSLVDNRLIELPCSVGNLSSLIKLILDLNSLKELPEEICNLKSLYSLSIKENDLRKLPESFGNLVSLEELILNRNRNLETLPESMAYCRNLEIEYVDCDKLKDETVWKITRRTITKPRYELKDVEKKKKTESPEEREQRNLIYELQKDLGYFSGNLHETTNLPKYWLEWSYQRERSTSYYRKEDGNIVGLFLTLYNKEIPSTVFKFKNLKVLGFKGFNSESFPKQLTKLSNLKKIYIIQSNFKTIPDFIAKAKKLEVLDLRNNKFETLSDFIGNLTNLKLLNLYGNNFEVLPDSIGNLQKLEELDASRNQINRISKKLAKLKSLKILKLMSNNLSCFPSQILELKNLEVLDLSYNDIKNTSAYFEISDSNLNSLKLLNLEHNSLAHIPVALTRTQFELLETLNLNSNELRKIPPQIKNMLKLIELDLSSNRIQYIPKYIQVLKSLQNLNLSKNRLNKIHKGFNELSSLKTLDLSDNKLTEIPKSFGNLKGLSDLNLNRNNLIKLPNSIGKLDLKYLGLLDNSLSELPERLLKNSILWAIFHPPKDVRDYDNRYVWFKNEKKINRDEYPLFNRIKIGYNNWNAKWKLNFFYKIYNVRYKIDDKIDDNQAYALSDLYDLAPGFGFKIDISEENRGVFFLNLQEKGIIRIPESISAFKNLKCLHLDGNNLSELPQSFENLAELEILNLRANRFKSIPPNIWSLKELKLFNIFMNPLDEECKRLVEKEIKNYQEYISDILEYCRRKATIRVFISYKMEEYKYFQIKKVSEYLTDQAEIYESLYCLKHASGNIDQYMRETIPKCQALLFFASNDSIENSPDCITELKLAHENGLRIIPVKKTDIKWNKITDLGEKLKFNYELGRNIGIPYNEHNIDDFCSKLYALISTQKENEDLFIPLIV